MGMGLYYILFGGAIMKIFRLDGSKFSDINGFYDEISNLLSKDLPWDSGHNFNAFHDLLCGGFGVHEYHEPIIIQWIHYSKSKKDLGNDTVFRLLEIMLNCDHTDHDVKVELFG